MTNLEIRTIGTRYTVLENLNDVWFPTRIISRDEFVTLLNIELGTTSHIENETLIIKGRFSADFLSTVITKLSLLPPTSLAKSS